MAGLADYFYRHCISRAMSAFEFSCPPKVGRDISIEFVNHVNEN